VEEAILVGLVGDELVEEEFVVEGLEVVGEGLLAEVVEVVGAEEDGVVELGELIVETLDLLLVVEQTLLEELGVHGLTLGLQMEEVLAELLDHQVDLLLLQQKLLLLVLQLLVDYLQTHLIEGGVLAAQIRGGE
jgi:hypothetical protein